MALLFGWVALVFVSSALVVGLSTGPVAGAGGPGAYLAATWEVADKVGPAVKLLLVALFAALVIPAERLRPHALAGHLALMALLGVVAMGLTLALIPEALSRGFGVGLTGARFDVAALPAYAVGGVAGGLVYAASAWSCEQKAARHTDEA